MGRNTFQRKRRLSVLIAVLFLAIAGALTIPLYIAYEDIRLLFWTPGFLPLLFGLRLLIRNGKNARLMRVFGIGKADIARFEQERRRGARRAGDFVISANWLFYCSVFHGPALLPLKEMRCFQKTEGYGRYFSRMRAIEFLLRNGMECDFPCDSEDLDDLTALLAARGCPPVDRWPD